MNALFRYYRRRMDAGQLDRDTAIHVFTKRAIKGVARALPSRISKNKWLGAINMVDRARPGFAALVSQTASKMVKRSPVGALRVQFLADLTAKTLRLQNDEAQDKAIELFTEYNDKFERDANFLKGIAANCGLSKLSCGHYHHSSTPILDMIDGRSSIDRMVCDSCANEMIESGSHVRARHSGFLIQAEYCSEAIDMYGATTLIDIRDRNFRRDERTGRWQHIDYSPYHNLIDSYHSSKAKGFKLIESQWFRSHRKAFGCELEVEARNTNATAAAGRIHEALNPEGSVGEYCYFERDGSVREGFEIVTQPAGLDVHRQKFEAFLKNPDLVRGLRSHEGGNCGFHVHVGRDYLTQSQIYRIQSFLNDVRNESLVRKIARRYGNGYSKIKYEMAKFSPHKKTTGDRYEALNVTGRHTVEFRIFRGSLRYESIMAALEFVNILIDFCMPGAVSIMEFNAIGFQKFVMRPNNRADTIYLRSYLSLDVETDNERQAA